MTTPPTPRRLTLISTRLEKAATPGPHAIRRFRLARVDGTRALAAPARRAL